MEGGVSGGGGGGGVSSVSSVRWKGVVRVEKEEVVVLVTHGR